MKLMIVDALNVFYRAYIVVPSINPAGLPVGGVYGFFKSLQKYCREIKPDRIIIAWDGVGGSRRRKAINKDYKQGRKPPRLNRFVNMLDEEQQEGNKLWQHARLIEYLSLIPVTQLVVDNVEADDIISYVVQHEDYGHWFRFIVSNDKDFYQLCSNSVFVFRGKTGVVTPEHIIEKYGIHPNNFALARAMAGDSSDNLEGVPRVGLKTVSNRFPFLKDETSYRVSDVLRECAEGDLKIHQNILEFEGRVRENYRLMNLSTPVMSYQAAQTINRDLGQPLVYDKMLLDGNMAEDGINPIQFNTLNQQLFAIYKEWKETHNG